MSFVKEGEPRRGVALDVIPGVRRIVARNAGSMTFHGTNTYLIEDGAGDLTVLDPGPDRPDHVKDVLDLAEGRIRRIVLSHGHSDHIGALPAVKEATGAPTYAWAGGDRSSFVPDVALDDGDSVAGLTAIHTPGHAPDHLCFAWRGSVLFSGDHVMAWATSIVSPPEGSMTDYIGSLRLLLNRTDSLYLAGHGPPLNDPHRHVRGMLVHRLAREAAIKTALALNACTVGDLTERLYNKADPILRRAAERNVLAHLIKLEREAQVTRDADVWQAALAS